VKEGLERGQEGEGFLEMRNAGNCVQEVGIVQLWQKTKGSKGTVAAYAFLQRNRKGGEILGESELFKKT